MYSSLIATHNDNRIPNKRLNENEKVKVFSGCNKVKKLEKHNKNKGINNIKFVLLCVLSFNFKGLFFKINLIKMKITNCVRTLKIYFNVSEILSQSKGILDKPM